MVQVFRKIQGSQVIGAIIRDQDASFLIAEIVNRAIQLSEDVELSPEATPEQRKEARALNTLCGNLWERAT